MCMNGMSVCIVQYLQRSEEDVKCPELQFWRVERNCTGAGNQIQVLHQRASALHSLATPSSTNSFFFLFELFNIHFQINVSLKLMQTENGPSKHGHLNI